MLVLWDASWAERLWCVFELAAFLKSREENAKSLVICPTLTGPVTFVIFIFLATTFGTISAIVLLHDSQDYSAWLGGFFVVGIVGASASTHTLRGFYRAVETMQRQLLSLRVAQLKCTCCSRGHIGHDGRRMICDREVISTCITKWFGSTDSFEAYIRTEVVEVATEQLERSSFNYAWSVLVCSPVLWALLDLARRSMDFDKPRWWNLGLWLTLGLNIVLLLFPMLVAWMKLLAHHFRRKSESTCRELLTNLFLVLCASPVVICQVGLFLICLLDLLQVRPKSLGNVAFAGVSLAQYALMWLLHRRGQGYLSRSLRLYRREARCTAGPDWYRQSPS
ncbi:unnamed protein product [Effrenium voratum]|uniref:Transmembrane protein n=1 Tax=Effrenium voratum TaxID=2562239 RepID=A0AA36ITZ6_9DINO|nr:unnamed protein product [Effrenium voratum]